MDVFSRRGLGLSAILVALFPTRARALADPVYSNPEKTDNEENKKSLTAYYVGENCIDCKYQDCAQVCPVDAFFEGQSMLVIDPNVCIACGVCEPECPANAIRPIFKEDEPNTMIVLNALFSKGVWRKANHNRRRPVKHGPKCGVKNKSVLSINPKSI